MKQWEIFLFPFREEQAHPAVILSPDERCTNPDFDRVNALICTSIRLNRPLKDNEAALDESDGLDWLTAVRCDVVHFLRKEFLLERRGLVSLPRRIAISRKLIHCLRLPTH